MQPSHNRPFIHEAATCFAAQRNVRRRHTN
jgi:hypothetical protein